MTDLFGMIVIIVLGVLGVAALFGLWAVLINIDPGEGYDEKWKNKNSLRRRIKRKIKRLNKLNKGK